MKLTACSSQSTETSRLKPTSLLRAITSICLLALSSLLVLPASPAHAQTTEQSEESIFFLKQRACAVENAGTWVYAPTPGAPEACLSDLDCAPFEATCKHRSVVENKEQFYPPLEFPAQPTAGGQGEGFRRYVPLCEDGSGNHEYAVSNGALGRPPTCAPETFIRCADGVRPYYRADAGTSNDWLIHAGGGGHASAPGVNVDAIWTLAHAEDAGAYSLNTRPSNRASLDGIFDERAINPFSEYNRIWLEKCTPDRWLGNKAHHDLADFTSTLTVEVVTGICTDADGSGTASCDDNLFAPGACDCTTKALAPPQSPDHAYSVYYHGKRIVRAALADILSGITTYGSYPLSDANGDGQADVRPGDEAFTIPNAASKIVFHCHSNGCNGLQGGHLDDLHAAIDAYFGADVDVRALFTGFLGASVEAESTVSEYDGIDDNPTDGVPDHDGDIDDGTSLYDHVVDDLSVTRQAMSYAAYEPGGREHQTLAAWWDPSMPDYDVPVDASCRAYHCPTDAPGWQDDPACAPCNESAHVVLNHLNTPFLYNQGQFDRVISRAMLHCETTTEPPTFQPCDTDGDFSGVDLVRTHWRKMVRKTLADLYRSGELDREEGGPGREWPYNQMMLLAPNWAEHGPLSEPMIATTFLTLPGAGGPMSLAALAHAFVHQNDADAPRKAICLAENTPGENALDFDDAAKGSIPACTQQGTSVSTEPLPAELPTGYALHPNYPNPFNPSTEIRFDLPEPHAVTLDVYDVTGRQVARILEARLTAGTYEVTFDADALSSGVYVYRLQAGAFTQYRRMLLLK